jgi:surfactin synthase thioesterase subunit
MELLMPLLRADFSLAETYTDRDVRRFDVDMTVFSGSRDADASPELMAGWKAYAGRGFRQHVIEGEHFFLNTNRVLLLNYVNAILVRTLQGTCPEASFQREYAYRPAM